MRASAAQTAGFQQTHTTAPATQSPTRAQLQFRVAQEATRAPLCSACRAAASHSAFWQAPKRTALQRAHPRSLACAVPCLPHAAHTRCGAPAPAAAAAFVPTAAGTAHPALESRPAGAAHPGLESRPAGAAHLALESGPAGTAHPALESGPAGAAHPALGVRASRRRAPGLGVWASRRRAPGPGV